jgi:hypothetical protein
MSTNTLLNTLEMAKWFFVAAYVFSTIGVTIGVYWENEQFPKEKQHRGWILLICALAADTFFTIMVFGIEGWIGHIQRGEIIALETRLAARSLSDEQFTDIVARLKPLRGQHFDIVTYWTNPESLDVTNRIYNALIQAGWLFDKPERGEFMIGVQTGILVWLDDRSDDGAKQAAVSLVVALQANGIAAQFDARPQNHAPNEPIATKIVINVGIKP